MGKMGNREMDIGLAVERLRRLRRLEALRAPREFRAQARQLVAASRRRIGPRLWSQVLARLGDGKVAA